MADERWQGLHVVGETPLHPRLAALLKRVHAAERTATGPQRRSTFRLMRELLAASVRLGVPPHALAELLGVTRDSIRSRAQGADGVLRAEQIERLTDLAPAELDRLSAGALSAGGPDLPRGAYRTSEVVRALVRIPTADEDTPG